MHIRQKNLWIQFEFIFRFAVKIGCYTIYWDDRITYQENFQIDVFPKNKQFPDFQLDLGKLTIRASNERLDLDDLPF